MNRFEEGLKIIEERCGNYKDNLISLATIDLERGADGKPRPCVRDLDAYYEDGVFYITTWGSSPKMKQIADNSEVAFSVCSQWFSGQGVAENLGWVLAPQNAEIRLKLRKTFEAWYDEANNEQDENCCILSIKITSATVIKDHGRERYQMDFVNRIAE